DGLRLPHRREPAGADSGRAEGQGSRARGGRSFDREHRAAGGKRAPHPRLRRRGSAEGRRVAAGRHRQPRMALRRLRRGERQVRGHRFRRRAQRVDRHPLMSHTYRYRSFFWPALLILAGIVALLVNTGQIPVDRLARIIDLWPLILVVIGLELIVRRTVHGVAGDAAAVLIVLLAIGGAAAYVAVGPAPSATHALEASDEVGGLTEATAEIDAGGATITVNGTTDIGADLFRAHIDYGGQKPEVRLDRAAGRLVISQRNSFPFFQSR